MARGKKHSPEQVVNTLRQIEVAVANGKTTPQACKEAGIVEQTYFRWRKEYGGLLQRTANRDFSHCLNQGGHPSHPKVDCITTSAPAECGEARGGKARAPAWRKEPTS